MELARIIIFTADVGRLVDFYASAFGLTVIGEADDGWTEMAAGQTSIAFHKLPFEVDGATDDGVKIVFGTSDVTSERERLIGLGIEMTEICRWGDMEYCDGSDPDGHRFQISSRGMV